GDSSLARLASIAQRQEDPQQALSLAGRAWAIIRRQAATLGGDEASQGFGTKYHTFSAQLAGYQLAMNQPEAAFTTLEEGRAQALQRLLVERRLTSRVVKPELWRPYQEAVANQSRAGKLLEQAGDM